MKLLYFALILLPAIAVGQKKNESPAITAIHVINESLVYSQPSLRSRVTDTMQNGDVLIGLRRYIFTVDSQELRFWHVANMVGEGYIQELASYSDEPWNISYDNALANGVPMSNHPNTAKEEAIDKKNLIYFRAIANRYREADKKLKQTEAQLQQLEEHLRELEERYPEVRRKYKNNMH